MIPDRNRVVYFGSMSRAALLVVAALVSLAGSARVRADAPPPLEVAIERYFAGEQAQGYAWLAAGDASLVAGGTLLAQHNAVMRGMSYPLLAVGLIQAVAGVSSLTRAEQRGANLILEAHTAPAAVRDREAARIGRINRLFKVIKGTEYALLGLGAAGAALGGGLHQDDLLGVGIGVTLEAALMLTLDHFAERRAHNYAEALGGVSLSVSPRSEQTTLVIGITRRF